MNWVLLAILGYVGLQLLIGVAVAGRMRTEQEYLLAGRRLGLPMIAMTIFATWFGAEACIGAAGIIYDQGLSGSRADPFGYALCILVLGIFFARKLWLRRLTTLADFYRQRFGPRVEKLGVLLLVPGSVLWAAAQILAFGHVLGAVSAMPLEAAIAFAAVIVIAYTALGGLLADAVSDLLQGGVLILGLGIIFVAVMTALPDQDALSVALSPERLSFRTGGESWLGVVDNWSIPIVGSLFATELVTRMLASRSPEVARNGALLGGGIYVLVGLIPVTLGLLGPALLPGLDDGEQLLPMLAQAYLPTVLYVVFLGALLSAILSTVDSALLNAGALVSHNVVVPLLRSTDERRKVACARVAVVSLGILAWALARSADSVFGLVEEASAFGSAGIFTCCLMGLSQKRGGEVTAMASMLTGITGYGVLAYVVVYQYAFTASLAGALGVFLMMMWFERGPEDPGADPGPAMPLARPVAHAPP